VASTLHKYQDLWLSHPQLLAKCQQLSDAIKVLYVAVANGRSRAQENEVTTAMVALMKVCQACGYASGHHRHHDLAHV
jgi:hypothetical protein